jgi:hypothetical protein
LSIRQAAGARAIHLAASGKRYGLAESSAVIDVAGRDRLAAASTHMEARSSSVDQEHKYTEMFLIIDD